MKKLPKQRYSGTESRPFWRRVRTAVDRDPKTTLVLYVAALHLQDVEARVLQLLEQAELHPIRTRKAR